MIPIKFPESNQVLEKPKGMTDEECMPLSVFVGTDTEQKPVIISCWQLSKEDLELINKTGKVYLQISGHQMPPACVYIENPFE